MVYAKHDSWIFCSVFVRYFLPHYIASVACRQKMAADVSVLSYRPRSLHFLRGCFLMALSALRKNYLKRRRVFPAVSATTSIRFFLLARNVSRVIASVGQLHLSNVSCRWRRQFSIFLAGRSPRAQNRYRVHGAGSVLLSRRHRQWITDTAAAAHRFPSFADIALADRSCDDVTR